MMHLILRIYINVNKYIQKSIFLTIIFQSSIISLNFLLTNLKFLVAVDDIYIEGTISQTFVLSLILCQNTGNFLSNSFEYIF